MHCLTRAAAASAAFIAILGVAKAQDASMQGGHGTGSSELPGACLQNQASAPPPMSNMPADMAAMGEHQAAMMEGMMATSGQMMQGIMAADADVAFACGMIPHHQAAINMAEAELRYGDDDQMKEMAQVIIDAQTQEIEQLTTWIEENAQ